MKKLKALALTRRVSSPRQGSLSPAQHYAFSIDYILFGGKLFTNFGTIILLLLSLLIVIGSFHAVNAKSPILLKEEASKTLNSIVENPQNYESVTKELSFAERILGTDSVTRTIFTGWPMTLATMHRDTTLGDFLYSFETGRMNPEGMCTVMHDLYPMIPSGILVGIKTDVQNSTGRDTLLAKAWGFIFSGNPY